VIQIQTDKWLSYVRAYELETTRWCCYNWSGFGLSSAQ